MVQVPGSVWIHDLLAIVYAKFVYAFSCILRQVGKNMKKESHAEKIYIMIVEKIRQLIEENGLGPGDRLPSERELSETLQAGRSSVREALRSLELLGLIETRKGEGTFLADFRNHRLVEILSRFILTNEQSQRDVIETKEILELAGLFLLMEREEIFVPPAFNQNLNRDTFFQAVFEQINNQLLYKIWQLITNFKQTIQKQESKISARTYLELVEAINERSVSEVIRAYRLHFFNKQ